jgi:hypothetical protein
VTNIFGKSWSISNENNYLHLTAITPSDSITPGQFIQVSFSATAPLTCDVYYEWTTSAFTNPNWSSDIFQILGTQPTVYVPCEIEDELDDLINNRMDMAIDEINQFNDTTIAVADYSIYDSNSDFNGSLKIENNIRDLCISIFPTELHFQQDPVTQ